MNHSVSLISGRWMAESSFFFEFLSWKNCCCAKPTNSLRYTVVSESYRDGTNKFHQNVLAWATTKPFQNMKTV